MVCRQLVPSTGAVSGSRATIRASARAASALALAAGSTLEAIGIPSVDRLVTRSAGVSRETKPAVSADEFTVFARYRIDVR